MSLPVTVRESVERGRDLVATEQLGAGRVVLTAAPLAAVPSDAFALSVCCGCLRHCSPSRRCPSCGAVLLCEGCATPMVVWRPHGTEPSDEERAHMEARLVEVATERFGEHWLDGNRRTIPGHWHMHARPKGGFYGF